jgi:hypothetical protein
MNSQAKIAAAQQALIDRKSIVDAVDYLKSDLLSQIALSDPLEGELRESLYRDYRAIDSVMHRLRAVITGGNFAAHFEGDE